MYFIISIILVSLLCCLRAETNLGPTPFVPTKHHRRVLVLVDDVMIQSTHSIFFDGLKKKGYELTFKAADDPTLALRLYGEWTTDNLIIFSPTVEEFGGFVDVPTILEFIDSGHNVLIGADSFISDPVREIASECGIEFDEARTFVIDHFDFDQSDASGDHTLIVVDQFLDSPVFGGPFDPVLFRGIGQDVSPNAKLVYKLASGSATSYSHAPDEQVDDAPLVTGHDTVLVSGLQALNNARVVVSGSLELFSDRFARAQALKNGQPASASKLAGNEKFAAEMTAWCFQERGALRASNIRHGHQDPAVAQQRHGEYRITDQIVYEIDVEQYDFAQDRWAPYAADDLQLEFIMLDPYVRLFLKHSGQGHYRAEFKLPDVYGVFTFHTVYNRPGYSHVETIDRVPVRPFRHDEYERFILSAFPYYAASFSMMCGLFIVSFIFLHHRDN